MRRRLTAAHAIFQPPPPTVIVTNFKFFADLLPTFIFGYIIILEGCKLVLFRGITRQMAVSFLLSNMINPILLGHKILLKS